MGNVVKTVVGVAASAVAVASSIAGLGVSDFSEAANSVTDAIQTAAERQDDEETPVSPRGTSSSK